MENKTTDAYGRSINGMIKFCILILIISCFKALWSPIGYLYWLGLILFGIICSRMTLHYIYRTNDVFKGKVDDFKEREMSILKKKPNATEEKPGSKIFSCPSCSQKLRVPKGRGKIEITCSSCQNKFIRRT